MARAHVRTLSVIVILGLHVAVACAEGGSGLVLPVTVALAVVNSVHHVAVAWAGPYGAARGPFGMLPAQLHIPDGYAIDVVPDPPRFARPVARDRLVSFDLLTRPCWTASVAYDEDSRGPLGRTGDVLRLFVEYPF